MADQRPGERLCIAGSCLSGFAHPACLGEGMWEPACAHPACVDDDRRQAGHRRVEPYLEALRDLVRRADRKPPIAELWRFAEIDRVQTVMRPYLEALT